MMMTLGIRIIVEKAQRGIKIACRHSIKFLNLEL